MMTNTTVPTYSPCTRTTCPYCGVGCGILATPNGEGQVDIKGDPDHPANFGRLCSKGSALGETVELDGRLLYPEIHGQRVAWEVALDAVASQFQAAITQYGPDAVAFYVSGQLLTEDYYVANKLMKGFIGSANIDTNSRLCMSSAVAAHKRAFGMDTVPCDYTDLELADLIVLVGSNTAWCHPVIYQRIMLARKQRDTMKIVVIDPRATATSAQADLHLPLKPGSDGYLFNGLLSYLNDYGYCDQKYIADHTQGYAEALAAAKNSATTLDQVAQHCDLTVGAVEQFYQWFARNQRVVTMFSQGINQSSSGVDKGNSIINCHLATGRIGKTGSGPFSITGQPNAMGGREVGGLANQLAAHLEMENSAHRALVQQFWQSPRIAQRAGLKAVDLFNAVREGKIKALWIMATNPPVSLPDANAVREALRICPFVVVSDCERATDTTQFADILLPAAAWGEKEGTVTNSERRISRQRAFLPLPGEAKPDWWILAEVGKRLGYVEQFSYQNAAQIFREHAALSGHNNEGTRDFDISDYANIPDEQFTTLMPFQWPASATFKSGHRLFADGLYYHADRKARFIPIIANLPYHDCDDEYPLILNTGRVRDHWHTMTRTGKSPRLTSHISEPFVAINPQDALEFNIQNQTLVKVTSRWGSYLARAQVTDQQGRYSLFAPIHWNDQFAKNASIDAVVNPVVDPISGQPEAKHTPVNITSYACQWEALILTRNAQAMDSFDYWVKSKSQGYWRFNIAGISSLIDGMDCFKQLFSKQISDELLEYRDEARNDYRYALIREGRLFACGYFAVKKSNLPSNTHWITEIFAQPSLTAQQRMAILAGKPASGIDPGPVVCSCFGVGRNTILAAVVEHQCCSVEALGSKLRAGTNCGSCIPELRAILQAQVLSITS